MNADQQIAVFDLETTGTDVDADRIVTAFAGVIDPDGHTSDGACWQWLVNPGIPIPAEASRIHGVDDAHAATGLQPATAVGQIVGTLAEFTNADIPIVVYNAPFDLTLLDREYRRHIADAPTVEHALRDAHILDPLVIDKALDRYRRGSRTLGAVAAHYGVTADGELHDARTDAVLAGLVMRHLFQYVIPADKTVAEVHDRQIEWYRQQRESFADYLRDQGKPTEAANVESRIIWPMHPRGDA